MNQPAEGVPGAPACGDAGCLCCTALACRTCEAQGVELEGRPCFAHNWASRHQVVKTEKLAGATPIVRQGPAPQPVGKAPKCPGCGVALIWDGWDEAFECHSGKHPGEGRGARAYVLGERGKLRPASPDADPTGPARSGKETAMEEFL